MPGPYDELEQVFHQPRRLELMTELCAGDGQRTFNELKESCELTDGNLSRHLQALEKAGAVKIKKSFVGAKPLTTVQVTKRGRESFVSYLDALQAVLHETAKRVEKTKDTKKELLPHGMKLVPR